MSVKTKPRFIQDRVCPICGKGGLSAQGLRGHLRFIHKVAIGPGEHLDDVLSNEAAAGGAPGDDTPSDVFTATSLKPVERGYSTGPGGKVSPGSVSELRQLVEKLKLEKERDSLLSQRREDVHVPDVSERLGLGPLRPEVAEQVQGRAFNVAQDSQDSTLKVLKIITEVKNLFSPSGDHTDSADSLIKTIQAITSIKQLFSGNNSPTLAPAGFQIDGVPLAGLDSQAIVAILEYLEKRKENEIEAKRQQGYQDLVADLFSNLSKPQVLEGIKGSLAGVGSQSRISAGQPQTLPCSFCKKPIDVTGVPIGSQVECLSCHNVYTLLPPEEAEPTAPANKVEAKATDFVLTCPSCHGQFYPDSLFSDSENVFCPKCGQDFGKQLGELKLEMQTQGG